MADICHFLRRLFTGQHPEVGEAHGMWNDFWEWLKPEDRHKRLAVVIAGASFAGFVTVNGASGIWTLFHSADKSAVSTTTTVHDSPGSVNGPVSGGTVTINNGPSPEQLEEQRRVQGAINAKLDHMMLIVETNGTVNRAIANGITEAAVRAIVGRLRNEGVDDRDLLPWLDQWIEAARRELATPSHQVDETLNAASREAERRFRAGQIGNASAAFMEALVREERQETVRQEERKRSRLRLLEKAVYFDELALNGEAAAQKLRLMAGIEGVSGPDVIGKRLQEKSLMFYKRGIKEGSRPALLISIAIYRSTLDDFPEKTSPQNWASTQNYLGLALLALGDLELGGKRLGEAANAFHSALRIWTKQNNPKDWAGAQNNLGVSLAKLGTRAKGTGELTKAVESFDYALQGYTKENSPFNWASVNNNRGGALYEIGRREKNSRMIESAIQSYDMALSEWSRERFPQNWAGAQNNLGAARQTLAEQEGRAQNLVKAVQAYENALGEWTRDRAPRDWASVKDNLGIAFSTLGAMEGKTEWFAKAAEAFADALRERTRERTPLDWALTQWHLGNLFRYSAEKQMDAAAAKQAIAAYEAALLVLNESDSSYYIGLTTRDLAAARTLLARLEAPH